MSEEVTSDPVQVTAEERSRPVLQLLARALILLAQQQLAAEQSVTPTTDSEPFRVTGGDVG